MNNFIWEFMTINKKAFQSKAKRSLSRRFRGGGYLHGEDQLNKFEHIWGGGLPVW